MGNLTGDRKRDSEWLRHRTGRCGHGDLRGLAGGRARDTERASAAHASSKQHEDE
jgi:hypothetical protein